MLPAFCSINFLLTLGTISCLHSQKQTEVTEITTCLQKANWSWKRVVSDQSLFLEKLPSLAIDRGKVQSIVQPIFHTLKIHSEILYPSHTVREIYISRSSFLCLQMNAKKVLTTIMKIPYDIKTYFSNCGENFLLGCPNALFWMKLQAFLEENEINNQNQQLCS